MIECDYEMIKMSNAKIERLAVHAVRTEALAPQSLLQAEIPEGDKGISFDGAIHVFKDESERVSSLCGSVPVQVKGTQVAQFTRGNREFRLNIEHYRNYYSRQGVLLLVVEVKNDGVGSTKIFYKHLMPKDLKNIIHLCEKKKSRSSSVELRPLEETNLDTVCRKFIDEREKQPLVLVEPSPLHSRDFETYNVTSLTFDPSEPSTSNIFEHDFYIYGIYENVDIPLKVGRISKLTNRTFETVEVNGETYNLRTKIISQKDKITWEFESVFQITYSHETNQINFKQLEFHSLEAQLKVIPFIITLCSGKTAKFTEGELGFYEHTKELYSYLKDMEEHYHFLSNLRDAFSVFGVPVGTIVKETEEGISLKDGFTFLIRAALDNDIRALNLSKPAVTGPVNLCIGDLLIVCYYRPQEQEKLLSLFSPDILQMECSLMYDGQEFGRASIYSLLNDTSLARGANVKCEQIKRSFDLIDPFGNHVSFGRTNMFCLHCISAYDKIKNVELLDTADYILSKYKRSNSQLSLDDTTILINQIQISKRKNPTLSGEQIHFLIDAKNSFPLRDTPEIHFCINVLLESWKEADYSFTSMSKESQREFAKMPIYQLRHGDVTGPQDPVDGSESIRMNPRTASLTENDS